MLIYGDRQNLGYLLSEPLENITIVNFSSPCEGYPIMDILPKTRFDIDDSQGFDLAFANYILSDDYRFKQFFNLIYELYIGHNVYVLVSKNEFYDMLNESLFKLIQSRYGYISNEINLREDIEYLTEGSFSIQGLYNLDIDKERYIRID